jgi:signal transduction histidine kinase
MNESIREYSPMRAGLFERWLLVWHVIYIGGLAITLGISLWRTRDNWGWRELALVAIVAILVVLYLRVVAFSKRWPHPNWFIALYYVVVICLLAFAAWLNPVFIWTTGMLFGQMFGILPPALAIPGAIILVLVWIFQFNDFRLPTNWNFTDALIIAGQLGMILLLYLYIYHLIRTSQERALLVNELRAAQAQLEHAREQEVELAALRERERMARDLHDGLGHSLVALSMQLEAVQRLYPVDPERASVQVDEMKRLTRDSMALLRQTLEGLRLPGLDGQALTTALPRLCADFSTRTGLSVQCEVDPATDNLRPAVSETLWRISQEALANIERHAQASVVALRLRVMPDAVFLYINDDGIGLPPGAETRPGHYGLRGMRERVEGLGGTLNIESENGTRLTARLPRA